MVNGTWIAANSGGGYPNIRATERPSLAAGYIEHDGVTGPGRVVWKRMHKDSGLPTPWSDG